VLVTGASSGIGAAVARELAGQGFSVFGTIRRPDDAAALAAAGAVPVRMDVTDGPSIAAARADVERALEGRPLAGLVNNAGIPAAGPLELLPLAELRRVLEVNLIGAVAVTQAFLPLLRISRGRIVNISSIAGRAAMPFVGPYAASKFGLQAVSDGCDANSAVRRAGGRDRARQHRARSGTRSKRWRAPIAARRMADGAIPPGRCARATGSTRLLVARACCGRSRAPPADPHHVTASVDQGLIRRYRTGC
jgi:NADP-dependent 3-hydroxy acid dehydrogenase YdfG